MNDFIIVAMYQFVGVQVFGPYRDIERVREFQKGFSVPSAVFVKNQFGYYEVYKEGGK